MLVEFAPLPRSGNSGLIFLLQQKKTLTYYLRDAPIATIKSIEKSLGQRRVGNTMKQITHIQGGDDEYSFD
jgi:hypothetical protein